MTIEGHVNYLGAHLETTSSLKKCFLEATVRTFTPADKKYKYFFTSVLIFWLEKRREKS